MIEFIKFLYVQIEWTRSDGGRMGSSVEILNAGVIRQQMFNISNFVQIEYKSSSFFGCIYIKTSKQDFFFRINRVDGSEAGDYKCTATNDAGTATAMANLVVQVKVSQ